MARILLDKFDQLYKSLEKKDIVENFFEQSYK